MGFLNPLFLLAAAAVAVPLILHLFHRHDRRRIAFPALRYLQRTEREHARSIRIRQLLLLMVRILAVLLLAAAGARPYLTGPGEAHDPTALAIVLDNSLSTGLVTGQERVLDHLKALALLSLHRATPEDRIWVLRTAEPGDVATPGSAEQARGRIRETRVSAAGADLSGAVARGAELVRESGLPAFEVHVLSDLQATAFSPDGPTAPGDVPIVVYRPREDPPPNRFIADVVVGGGLAPLAGQRSEIVVATGASGDATDEESPVRLFVGSRVRAAGSAPPGSAAVLPLGPFSEAWVTGHVENDPDALAGDDRRYFAFAVRPPPAVALAGDASFFLSEALGVLVDAGRARAVPVHEADVILAVAGEGSEARSPGAALVIVPPSDPSVLPALNRRLAAAGIPWTYEPPGAEGEVLVRESTLPLDLGGTRVYDHFTLTGGEGPVPPAVRVHLTTGDPWLLTGLTPDGPFLLLASPLDPEATNLPVTAVMVPLLEWMLGEWAAPRSGDRGSEAGQPIRTPEGATAIRDPGGTLHPLDGTSEFRATREAGVYTVLRGDSVLAEVAVNPPVRESYLERLEASAVRGRLGGDVRTARDSASWERAIFVSRKGPEVWRPLLLAVIGLLLVETWIAAAGRAPRRRAAQGQTDAG